MVTNGLNWVRATRLLLVAGGLLAVGIMAWHGVLLSMLSNAFRIMVGMPRRGRGLRNPPMVPYGIAIAAGTLYAVFIQTY